MFARYRHKGFKHLYCPRLCASSFLVGFTSLLLLDWEPEPCHRSVNRIISKSEIIKAEQTPQFWVVVFLYDNPTKSIIKTLGEGWPLYLAWSILRKTLPPSTREESWRSGQCPKLIDSIYMKNFASQDMSRIPFQNGIISTPKNFLPQKIGKKCPNLPTLMPTHTHLSRSYLKIPCVHRVLNWLILYLARTHTHTQEESMASLHAESPNRASSERCYKIKLPCQLCGRRYAF